MTKVAVFIGCIPLLVGKLQHKWFKETKMLPNLQKSTARVLPSLISRSSISSVTSSISSFSSWFTSHSRISSSLSTSPKYNMRCYFCTCYIKQITYTCSYKMLNTIATLILYVILHIFSEFPWEKNYLLQPLSQQLLHLEVWNKHRSWSLE